MRDNFNVIMFESFIKINFGEELTSAPVNSMTPFILKYDDHEDEYIFIVKAESWLYDPLKDKTIDDTFPMGVKAYMENESLIFGFEIEPDINLESEIPKGKIINFLRTLAKQEILTVVIVDHLTFNIVWLTNDYPFNKVKEQFKPLFEKYGIR